MKGSLVPISIMMVFLVYSLSSCCTWNLKNILIYTSVLDPDPDPHGSGTFAWIQLKLKEHTCKTVNSGLFLLLDSSIE